jgi:Leucine-rich repeat (LRR) protein
VKSTDKNVGTAIKNFHCPTLQFLNISCLEIKSLTMDIGLQGLIEVVAHTNNLTNLRGLSTLPNLYLLDVENNRITDDYVPEGVEVLNSKFNSISTATLHIK